MKEYEVFQYHKQTGNNLFAAIAAVDISFGKSSRSARGDWLDAACRIYPEWRSAANTADMTGNFAPLYELIRKALAEAGKEAKEVWNI